MRHALPEAALDGGRAGLGTPSLAPTSGVGKGSCSPISMGVHDLLDFMELFPVSLTGVTGAFIAGVSHALHGPYFG